MYLSYAALPNATLRAWPAAVFPRKLARPVRIQIWRFARALKNGQLTCGESASFVDGALAADHGCFGRPPQLTDNAADIAARGRLRPSDLLD